MTLDQKIRLIDDLIRENLDVTVRDYLDLVKEVDGIQRSMEIRGESRRKVRFKHIENFCIDVDIMLIASIANTASL